MLGCQLPVQPPVIVVIATVPDRKLFQNVQVDDVINY